jgi:NADH-quinone oxidoreductase subunit K
MLAESLFFSAVLFAIGVAGVLIHRNAIIVFMCVELMLNAVNLTFVAFAQVYGVAGQVFVFIVMTVAAAEAAVGLAIIIALFRHRQTVNLQNIDLLKGRCCSRKRLAPRQIRWRTPRPRGCGPFRCSRCSGSSSTACCR